MQDTLRNCSKLRLLIGPFCIHKTPPKPLTTYSVEKCRATAKLFDDVQTGTEFVSLDPGEELPDRESLLRLCVVSMAVRS